MAMPHRIEIGSEAETLRTLALLGLLGIGALGCEERVSSTGGSGRREAIFAAPGEKQQEPQEARPVAEAKVGSRSSLCGARPNHPLPQTRISGLGTLAAPFEGGVPAASGLSWISLWAAWCEPCKKEIPLLLSLERRMKEAGLDFRVEFISLDDDERQLAQFLTESRAGLKKTFWLKEGSERETWLRAAMLPTEPRLPVQLLVDRGGNVFCRIDGSIEQGDMPAIEKTLRTSTGL